MNNILRDYKSILFDASFRVLKMIDKELNDMHNRNKFRDKAIVIEAERLKLQEHKLPEEILTNLSLY